MPFIRGRYHINAIAGEALQAAREAEEAALALQHDSASEGSGEEDGQEENGSSESPVANNGPIHRVEIEAAELVPAHTGRAQRGFVAHVHREAPQPGATSVYNSADNTSSGASALRQGQGTGITSLRSPRPGQLPTAGYVARPETHVFSDHHDLVNFLRDEFAKQCGKK
jgi:hypothetical protein